jgi:hypothetical protein
MSKDIYVPMQEICQQVMERENIEPEKVIDRIVANQKEVADLCAVLSVVNMVRHGQMNSSVFKAIAEAALEFVVAKERGIDPDEMMSQAMRESNRKQREMLRKCEEEGIPHTVTGLTHTNDGIVIDADSEKTRNNIRKAEYDS